MVGGGRFRRFHLVASVLSRKCLESLVSGDCLVVIVVYSIIRITSRASERNSGISLVKVYIYENAYQNWVSEGISARSAWVYNYASASGETLTYLLPPRPLGLAWIDIGEWLLILYHMFDER
jgi:hypothetical protein